MHAYLPNLTVGHHMSEDPTEPMSLRAKMMITSSLHAKKRRRGVNNGPWQASSCGQRANMRCASYGVHERWSRTLLGSLNKICVSPLSISSTFDRHFLCTRMTHTLSDSIHYPTYSPLGGQLCSNQIKLDSIRLLSSMQWLQQCLSHYQNDLRLVADQD